MPTDHRAVLAKIKRFDQLIAYLRDEMGWPIARDSFEDVDDLFYDFTADELGIDTKNAAKIQEIKRLRPLSPRQPWGIFFVKFEPKKLPVVALRRILSQVALKKRASANSAERSAWAVDDLLFVSNYGEGGDDRRISFAHFSHAEAKQDLPTLKVLGWDNLDTPLHLDDVAETLTTNLAWPEDDANVEAWRNRWRGAFTLRHREVVTTSKELSLRLAELARAIRDRIKTALAIETDRGPLSKLMKAFQTSLVHDLDADGFADMYAQTIAYGLLSARIADPRKKTVDDLAGHMRTSPFLRELMETFLHVGGRRGKAGGLGIDFDELGVSEVVELLDDANMEAVVRDFGDLNPQEDPVIHFYELFLSAYNKQLKIQRGVFYTPQSVVSYIVRSVHELLQTEFGLADGLADTTTWGEMVKKHPGLKLPLLTDEPAETRTIDPDEPYVQILDPATGTATFLVKVIDVIFRTLTEKWKEQRLTDAQQRAAWNEYVPKHLLPRLHAFELMMAPYAIAHMKVGLKLAETGYRFGTEERARIYLTNALEPWVKQLPLIGFEALAHEAAAVNEVKRHKRFTVVVGNPPYDYESQNNGEYIQTLVDHYYQIDGKPLGERNPRGLQDDYVKFVRFAECILSHAGAGVFGFITNNSFLDNPTYRGMRFSLLSSYQKVWFLNLHGNSNVRALGSSVTKDENVFDIKQSVSISLFAKTAPGRQSISCKYYEIYGLRDAKTDFLASSDLASIAWNDVVPSANSWRFIPLKTEGKVEYDNFAAITSVMPLNSVGLYTARDNFVIAEDPSVLLKRMKKFISLSPSAARKEFQLGDDSVDWGVEQAQRDVRKSGCNEKNILPISYRPFDRKHTYYTGKSSGVICRPRPEIMAHMISGQNTVLCFLRRSREHICSAVFVAKDLIDKTILSSADNANVAPLFLYSASDELSLGNEKRVNFSPHFLKSLVGALGSSATDQRGLPKGITPEDIFHYIYAVFYSPTYRTRYAEFLKIDFPRLPLTGNLELFRTLARLGGELVALHLLDSPELDKFTTEFVGGRNPEVEKLAWSKNTVWVDKAQTTGFKGVREDAWNFHIGGYQVCEKWLKDRKGRTLSKQDISHYQKIVVALNETIRLMKEIDEVIEKHGGWPGAFSVAPSSESSAASVQTVADEIEPAIREYGEAAESLPLAAEAAVSFGGKHHAVTVDEGVDGDSASAKKTKTEAIADNDLRRIDDIEQFEIMAIIRQVFNDGAARNRETAMREVAHELGFDRTGSRIQERLDSELIAAVRRGVVSNERGELSLATRTIEDYSREYLKTLFLSDMGSVWWDREEAINRASRYLGFARTGARIYDSFKSIINGLIRDGRLESNPEKGIRRV